jgi:toxin-antitoxin system PIN domain toxin
VKVVDANVLLYAVNSDSPGHTVARVWLDDALSGNETVGFSWVVLLAFLRISTHPSIFPNPLAPETACEIMETWLSRPAAVVLDPTARHLGVLKGLLSTTGSAGNLVNDAHLAALATEHGADITSFDTDFDRFNGIKRHQPS